MTDCAPGGICGWDCHALMARGGIFQLIAASPNHVYLAEKPWHKEKQKHIKKKATIRNIKRAKKKKHARPKKDKNKKNIRKGKK